jgi:hypothetical protein
MLKSIQMPNGHKVLRNRVWFTVCKYDLVSTVLYATSKGICTSNRKVVIKCLDEALVKFGLEGLTDFQSNASQNNIRSAERTVAILFPELER